MSKYKKYCRLCKKKETQGECSYGSKMWSKYSVDDASDGEISAAETEADGGGDGGDSVGEGFVNGIYDLSYVSEEGLKDWFGKSKSNDASGALVKYRKKGAANWGNSDKKEEFQGFTEAQIAALEAAGAIEVNEAGQKCWCVKKEEIELTDAYGETFATIEDIVKPEPIKVVKSSAEYDIYDIDQIIGPAVTEATRMPAKTGNVYLVMFSFRGKLMSLKLFFPDMKKPSRKEVEYALQGAYPSAMVRHYYETPYQAGESYYQAAMGESTVPGKPAEKLGAVTAIPKDDQDAAKARILAKAKEKANSGAEEQKKQLQSKEKRVSQMKKMVLLQKMKAVRSGAGAEITASYDPAGEVIDETLTSLKAASFGMPHKVTRL